MVNGREHYMAGLAHARLSKSPLRPAEKCLERSPHITEIPEKWINAGAFPPANPPGRNLLKMGTHPDWLYGRLDADLVQRALPRNRFRQLFAEDFESKRQISDTRPEEHPENRLKYPVQYEFYRIVIDEPPASHPPIRDHLVAVRFDDLTHHSVHRHRLRLKVGGHQGDIVAGRSLHA